jgi:hypothetical protein
MNLILRDVTKTNVHGKESKVELIYIKGSQVRREGREGGREGGRSHRFGGYVRGEEGRARSGKPP